MVVKVVYPVVDALILFFNVNSCLLIEGGFMLYRIDIN